MKFLQIISKSSYSESYSASLEINSEVDNGMLEKCNASKGPWLPVRVKAWKLSLLGAAILIAIALGAGLGVGLRNGGSSGNASSSSPANITITNTSTGDSHGSFWSPTASTSWQIELAHPLTNTTFNASVYDIDIFDNNTTTITTIHNQGRKVICYFSAGSYENWRPDAGSFNNKTDLGNPVDGWPGEWWLDTNSANVRKIMLSRLDLAAAKGCDGVDPDNVDGYDNDNGLGLILRRRMLSIMSTSWRMRLMHGICQSA